jgi:LPLT family lysophospholipid transporter-like MFS transporter
MSNDSDLSVAPARNYPLLLWGQFLSAFGDNAILAIIIGQLTYLQKAGSITEASLRESNAVYTAMLFVPYVLLAPLAGYLNDRHAKTTWLVGGNALKLLGTLICALSLWSGTWWQAVGYFIIGIGSCIYGPAKYGILPEILPKSKLVKANGAVEMLTLVAVLSGFIIGSGMSDKFHDQIGISFSIIVVIYAGALALNFFMGRTPSNHSVQIKSSVSEFFSHTGNLVSSPRLGRMLLGTALFWIVGTAMKSNFQSWGLNVLKLDDNTQISLLALWLIIGVIIGSVLAGVLHKVGDLSKIPLYGFGMAVMFVLAYTVGLWPFWLSPVFQVGSVTIILPVAILLVVAGAFAGLFLIPMNAALQAESDPTKLGKTIAVQNLFDNIGMCLAMLYVFVGARLEISSSGIFLGLGVGTLLVTAAMSMRRKLS